MHALQEKLLSISDRINIGVMSLRAIGKLVGEDHPEKIRHHLRQLEKRGLVNFDPKHGKIKVVKQGIIKNTDLVIVPILGSANCGPAALYARENIEGYLKISNKLLRKNNDIFAIQASGFSMNKASVNGRTIEDGDYCIINARDKSPRNGDYVLAVIDETTNIKKYIEDAPNKQIVLVSESTKSYPPIYIHPDDKFIINGKVIQIIKKPKLKLTIN